MEEKLKDLEEKVNILLARQSELEQEIENLKKQHFGTGLVLEGCNEYNKSYIHKAIYGDKGE